MYGVLVGARTLPCRAANPSPAGSVRQPSRPETRQSNPMAGKHEHAAFCKRPCEPAFKFTENSDVHTLTSASDEVNY
jgi:hypothetical protein